jgi:hypothetical protein
MQCFKPFSFGAGALAIILTAAPIVAFTQPARAQIGVSVSIAPPALPVYAQPPIPGPGYIWTPGYWAWNGTGYYWVPGTWVQPPTVGVLWTPGYWGWSGGAFGWNAGFWGASVGFYGGINYGFGYGGAGYSGGYWNNGAFNYNTGANNIGNTHIGNTYNGPVTINRTTNISNVSYNGGQGGTAATPTAAQQAYASQQHIPPTQAQVEHQQTASNNPALSYANNKGVPPIGATSKPGEFQGAGVTSATAAGKGPAGQTVGTSPNKGPTGQNLGASPNKAPPAPHVEEHAAPHPATAPHPAPVPHPAAAPHPVPHPVPHVAPRPRVAPPPKRHP